MKTRLTLLLAITAATHLVASSPTDQWEVHEWGTFTTVAGADGLQISWNPLLRTDLPGFVYDRGMRREGVQPGSGIPDLTKSSLQTFVRMETPVIYFYSDIARTADVVVNFPEGRVTEWYPQASAVGPYHTTASAEKARAQQSFIEWRNIAVLPRDTTEITEEALIREKDPNHYYAARDTDANLLRTEMPFARRSVEFDRMLFYRGVGMFQAPITVQLTADENQMTISTTNAEPLTDLFILTIRNGMARYQFLDRVAAEQSRALMLAGKTFKPLSEVREQLMKEMVQRLEKQGLFAREAQAMVATWKDQWFEEEGLRVLYILPQPWTDRALPLTVAPVPRKAVRVMVGRAEVITPTMEWELLKQVVRYSEGDAPSKAAAAASVQELGLGRFTEPAVRRILGQAPSRAFSTAAWNLANSAHATTTQTSPVAKSPSPALPEPSRQTVQALVSP